MPQERPHGASCECKQMRVLVPNMLYCWTLKHQVHLVPNLIHCTMSIGRKCALTVCPRKFWGLGGAIPRIPEESLIRKFRTDVGEAHEISESCRLTRVTEAVPAENRLDSEYSRRYWGFEPDVSIGPRRRQPVFQELRCTPATASSARVHNRVHKSGFVRRVGRTLRRSCATGRHADRSLSLGPPGRFLAVVEG